MSNLDYGMWQIVAVMFTFTLAAVLPVSSADNVSTDSFCPAEHPFLLWTVEEAEALRERIHGNPVAKRQYENMLTTEIGKGNPTLLNLFKYMVMGDQAAGEYELKKLRGFIGKRPEPMTWDIDLESLQWNVGMPSAGDSHQRDEQTLNTLRYDVLYHLLSKAERQGVEQSMKDYIQFHLEGGLPRHPAFRYDRMSWLPNMHWPRAIGTHLMAVALQEPELIQAMFESDGGFKWYLDEYLSSEGFYMEEFGKYYSNVGTMLMYCEALERLCLGQFGYGYTGRGGATMRKYLEMLPRIAYPRLEAEKGGTPRYPAVTMGDAGITGFVGGRDAQGKGGSRVWTTARMNGPLPKMGAPLWYEVGHRRFPDAGFDYFLAQLRLPGAEQYLPSLYWGLEPVSVNEVKPPPPPGGSYASPERGFALLRMEHSPLYWEAARPAVALQFAMYYVHYVHDCFALLQYVSHNRMLYDRLGSTAGGYAGGDAWRDHVRGHNGVVVDGLQANPVDSGNNGTPNQQIRTGFEGSVRFTAVQAEGVYPAVNQERALFLTDQYLFDVFWLVSPQRRVYDWQIIAIGHLQGLSSAPWMPVDKWNKTRDIQRPHLNEVHVMHPGAAAWSATVLQDEANPASPRQIGVKIHMLGADDTFVLGSRPPGLDDEQQGVSVLASREASATVFAALHEPFEGGAKAAQIEKYELVGQNNDALAVRVTGSKNSEINDRLLFARVDASDKPVSLTDGKESFTFAGHGFVRIGSDIVEIRGDVRAIKIHVQGNPVLMINDTKTPCEIVDGVLML